ncbi:hypothetical protein V5E97_06420 [Singulisphaera sp. Ch08]|uniref:Uncharacterized protein n=1 Tax=Singulisphaera sp. Ch08 TaxID=3120278 RepID=A0AAU7CKW3_9BACT
MMIAVVILGSTMGGAISCYRALQNRLTVVNHSGQRISRLQIIVDGTNSVVTFKDIPIGEQAASEFGIIWGDGYYDVSGVLADGTQLKGTFGYLTNGMFEVNSRFIIKEGGLIDFHD